MSFIKSFNSVSNIIQNFVPSLYGDLALSLSFDIAINNEVQLGTNLNPILIITSNEIDNYSYSLNFDVLVGLLIENFETGDFSCHDWISEGQNGWTVSSASAFDGIYSATSGQIENDQFSNISININITTNGILEFDYRVSAEYSTSGDFFYDGLEFYIDGNLIDQLQTETDGSSPWNHAQYEVNSGTHEFNWSFVKDGAGGGTDCINTNCEDAAFIDNLKFPISEPHGTPGDVNNDGEINVLDVVLSVSIVLDNGYDPYADLNGDGSINVLDIVQIVNLILEQ